MLCMSNFSMALIKFSVEMVHFWQCGSCDWQCGSSDKLVHLTFIAIKRHKILQFTHQLGAFRKDSMLSCLKCNWNGRNLCTYCHAVLFLNFQLPRNWSCWAVLIIRRYLGGISWVLWWFKVLQICKKASNQTSPHQDPKVPQIFGSCMLKFSFRSFDISHQNYIVDFYYRR